MKQKEKKKNGPPVTIRRGADHVVIEPRNLLKAKAAVLLSSPQAFDETAIRRAEQALKALSINFSGWMEEAARNLAAKRDEFRSEGSGNGRMAALHRVAHDIRGQATTLGFPLAARVGASLCRLLEDLPTSDLQGGAFLQLVDQHVDAIRAIVRESAGMTKDRVGEALTAELEAITERLLSGKAAQALH